MVWLVTCYRFYEYGTSIDGYAQPPNSKALGWDGLRGEAVRALSRRKLRRENELNCKHNLT